MYADTYLVRSRQAWQGDGERPFFAARVPGSKSITNRALLLAMLSDGDCLLEGALFSEDSRVLVQAIRQLGFEVEADEEAAVIRLKGLGGFLPKREASVYVGSAGTAARFLTALLGLKEGIWHLDASEQMRRRPMKPLLDSLVSLGCQVIYEGEEGHFPFTLRVASPGRYDCCKAYSSSPDQAAVSDIPQEVWEDVTVNIEDSSQFLSALLIASCCSGRNLAIHIQGSHGMSYIDMTLRMMEQFGVKPQRTDDGFRIARGQCYRKQNYFIEPDVSAACYFYALAALLGIRCRVDGVSFASMQADVQFIRLLAQMGCVLTDDPDGITLTGPVGGRLHGLCADLHSCSDQAITLAAIAPYADSETMITGIGHIRHQECDRMHAISTELHKRGIKCEEAKTSLRIQPGIPLPGEVDTYEDHRMAMGFSLLGLRAEGIVIRNPGCCKKTFEGYFQLLDQVLDQLAW